MVDLLKDSHEVLYRISLTYRLGNNRLSEYRQNVILVRHYSSYLKLIIVLLAPLVQVTLAGLVVYVIAIEESLHTKYFGW